MSASPTSLVSRALGPDWKRWRRKLPAHLRTMLPYRSPGGDLGRTLAQMVLRARRAWIADGRPAVGAEALDLRQVEREWWGAMLLTGAATNADKPAAPAIDRIHADGTIQMRQAAPEAPKPKWVGKVPAELVDGWLLLRQFGAVKVGGTWSGAVMAKPRSGRHSEARHQLAYPALADLFVLLSNEMRTQPKSGDVANNWNWGNDRRTHAVIAAWHAGRLQSAQGAERRVEIYDALERLKDLRTTDPMGDLAHVELVHWLSERLTAAKRPAGGRLTLKMAAELLLRRDRLLRRVDDRALLQILTLQARSVGQPSHHERCRQAVVSLTPPVFREREMPNSRVFFFDHEQKTGT